MFKGKLRAPQNAQFPLVNSIDEACTLGLRLLYYSILSGTENRLQIMAKVFVKANYAICILDVFYLIVTRITIYAATKDFDKYFLIKYLIFKAFIFHVVQAFVFNE